MPMSARGPKKKRCRYLDYFLVADTVIYANIKCIVRHGWGLPTKLNIFQEEAYELFCGLSLSAKSGAPDPREHHRERRGAGFDGVIVFVKQAKIFWVVRELPTGSHVDLKCNRELTDRLGCKGTYRELVDQLFGN